MSKEAVGQLNTKIGSSEYWSKVNRNTILGGLMGAKTSYQATLRELGRRSSAAIEEIYGDLSNLGSRIRFLDSSNRKALAKQVEGLYDVCKMTGVTVWHNSECVQGLNLSMMSPWTRNFRDERGIERAIAIINKTRYSEREVVDLLKDASKWGIDSAAGRDTKKRAFLEAVAQGSISSRFLEDIAEEYQNQSSRQSYEGKCGQTVGSRSYMEYMETQVFGTLVSGFGNPDYARFLRDALRSIATQLERDLDNAIRENDYITDETAAILKSVVSELDTCGVSTGSLNSKIEKLAWFVGGDPTKIKELQRALNSLGVGQHLEEDGVYGDKTKLAGDKLIDDISEVLTDPNKVRNLSKCIDLYLFLKDVSNVFQTQYWALRQALKAIMPAFQRTVWKWGAEHYLRPRGYAVAALLLEHSLNKSPQNLYFPQGHWVTQKVIQSKGFKRAFAELERNMQENPDVFAVNDAFTIDFQLSNDTDLYYAIGVCEVEYTCVRHPTSVSVKFTIEDKYNFDRIRLVRGDIERFVVLELEFGNLANDAGLISQADGVISIYYSYISFEKTIELN